MTGQCNNQVLCMHALEAILETDLYILFWAWKWYRILSANGTCTYNFAIVKSSCSSEFDAVNPAYGFYNLHEPKFELVYKYLWLCCCPFIMLFLKACFRVGFWSSLFYWNRMKILSKLPCLAIFESMLTLRLHLKLGYIIWSPI